MSLYVRRSIKATATVQRGVLNDLWNKVAPYIVLDPKHTFSYLIKTRNDKPSGPYGAALTDGSVKKGYRFPAPGNLEHPSIPDKTSNRNYEITHYTRDTSRTTEPVTILKVDPSRPLAIEGTDFIPLTDGSPGNKNIDVLNYDQSGLRTAMTTSHEALQASLAALQPNHLPESAWEGDAEDIIREYTEKGLSPVPGRSFEWNVTEQQRNPVW
mmetsp:Transcript_12055/g.17458  ORF Transcript_12055/g.17458 Transcript_12055/m.17458 type:complete len:212 (-) Transcript_12055:62-697(-)|eukprot:CAMPEP_0195517510 /NCGR_PEP_ID=MMETSP0794_2-20130614/10984_1 /TAXON_ID=515487 /ORGANISM="Stephanopyxis turris, Strain CCMP 815" /LENGTH=211 /DNA_ID=CAMNT_0040646325 /DNA_START=101 /DNA_END=733 /DNA_ORIENTATION=-